MPDDESIRLAEKPHASVVICPVCDLHVPVTEPNDAVDLYRRHANVIGHGVEWECVTSDVDIEGDGMKTALTEPGEDHPDGVEFGRLVAALADNGVAIGETSDTVRDPWMNDEIYEPQGDYVFAV